jgi:HEAT repeat protein
VEPAQLEKIFNQTLKDDYDDESAWEAVRALHLVGSREVFDRAAAWCSSDNSLKRARGVDILAQLGNTSEHPGNKFPVESFSVISDLVKKEKDPLPLLSALHAVGHIGSPLAIPLLVEHHRHPTANVRFAVACSLGNFADDPSAVETLMALMQDVDDDVRDWATFGLGVLGSSDSGEIRDALCQRMTDSNKSVREEALRGLGKRKELRALHALITELSQPEVLDGAVEAAESFLDENDNRAHWGASDYVVALKKRFSV